MPTSRTVLVFDRVDHAGSQYIACSSDDLISRGVPADDVLALVKGRLSADIDAAAEDLRARVATAGSGQAMEYQRAETEAIAALAAKGTLNAADYPMLAASVGIDVDPQTGEPASDVLGVARSVKAASDAWTVFGAGVRRARLAGKAAVDAAASIEAALSARDAISWPATA